VSRVSWALTPTPMVCVAFTRCAPPCACVCVCVCVRMYTHGCISMKRVFVAPAYIDAACSTFPGTDKCSECPTGRFANETGLIQCRQCPAGRAQTQRGQPVCDICLAGFFAPIDGSDSCTKCAAGSYQSEEGMSYSIVCACVCVCVCAHVADALATSRFDRSNQLHPRLQRIFAK